MIIVEIYNLKYWNHLRPGLLHFGQIWTAHIAGLTQSFVFFLAVFIQFWVSFYVLFITPIKFLYMFCSLRYLCLLCQINFCTFSSGLVVLQTSQLCCKTTSSVYFRVLRNESIKIEPWGGGELRASRRANTVILTQANYHSSRTEAWHGPL